jgi:hypothetical protein
VSALEGLWTTGQVDIEVIRHAMTDAGIPKAEVDAWVEEVGAPAWYSFELDFTGDRFEHLQATPDSAMEVDEGGTFTLEGDQLVVSITHDGEVDTYTFAVDRHDDDLALTWVSSTEQGEPGDMAHHRRYTIAFYCSATFHRQAT